MATDVLHLVRAQALTTLAAVERRVSFEDLVREHQDEVEAISAGRRISRDRARSAGADATLALPVAAIAAGPGVLATWPDIAGTSGLSGPVVQTVVVDRADAKRRAHPSSP